MSDGIQQWWNSIPQITRYLFALSFGVTLAANFRFIQASTLVLNFQQVFYSFEIWRLVTCFFFHGKLGFPFLIHMLFLVRYGQSLEETVFNGRTADFVWFLLFGGFLLLIFSYFLHLEVLGMSFIMMILYVWSRKNPNLRMSFMFGLQFQSFYFAWVLVGFTVLMGGNPIPELLGIVSGHVYYYLEDIYPQIVPGARRWLKTPQFLYDIFPPASNYGGNNRITQSFRHQRNWGRGESLGGN